MKRLQTHQYKTYSFINTKFFWMNNITLQCLEELRQSLLNIPNPKKKFIEKNDSELVSNAAAFISQGVPFNQKDLMWEMDGIFL